jgi:putative hydrolase of the HAD superfamily
MTLDMIAFDADDTLWHGEVHYREAQAELHQILAPWRNAEEIDLVMDRIEMKNLPLYGYGAKPFILSMLEAAVELTNGEISGAEVDQILALGRQMLEAEIRLIPDIPHVLQELSKDYPLMVITKGDLLDQTDKVERSGLADYFGAVEVVKVKTPDTYQAILNRYPIDPARFLMIGNSLPSDILPVLEIGGAAIHIPADTTWAHETVADFDGNRPGFYELEGAGQLPDFIRSHFPPSTKD